MKEGRVCVERSGWLRIGKDGNILPLPNVLQQTATGIDDDDYGDDDDDDFRFAPAK
jgi:hypothetical protein